MNRTEDTTTTQDETPERTRAVIYARTDREPASHSVKDQCKAACTYAAGHDIEIVRVYTDIGKSGSTLGGMHAMQRLLKDMSSPDRGFDVILVYDLSRCGRFQSADEIAHFEYACHAADIEIQTCVNGSQDDACSVSDISECVRWLVAGSHSKEL
ncbi:MAG: recombinase family protein [Candidatus Marsarchaeota archaeon]|nr:recombinase family protein [Candidatus Marsarchaeota archaeon]